MKTKEELRKYLKQWREKRMQDPAYKAKINEYSRKRMNKKYNENTEFRKKQLQKVSEYNKINREEKTKYLRKYREENRDQLRTYWREYKRTEKGKESRRDYVRNKRHTDINYKILTNLRNRLKHAINGNLHKEKTLKLLGCTIEQFRIYLEPKFTTGMSWSNYGEWHIDHIKPCSSYDISDPVQQAACFHYTNLQPLWAIDNLKKGDAI
jgi:hypothetical protein